MEKSLQLSYKHKLNPLSLITIINKNLKFSFCGWHRFGILKQKYCKLLLFSKNEHYHPCDYLQVWQKPINLFTRDNK